MPWTSAFAAILAASTLVLSVGLAIDVARGHRALPRLRDLPTIGSEKAPRLSVVIPARNEAETIEPALRSMIAQDYPDLEIVVVDDRSTDDTGAIVDHLAGERSDRLTALHVADLPDGWLGKAHALHVGAGRARGEILLFTDADVVMAPTAASRAVRHLMDGGFDHLTVAARLVTSGPLLDLAVGSFVLGGVRAARPWRVTDPESGRHLGVGAFNMVRSAAYRAIGGHEPIRLMPADDLELARRIKAEGYRSAVLLGDGMVEVEWYRSTAELVRGLRKNAFAAVGYRLSRLVALTLIAFALDVWPWAALVLLEGPARWMNGAIALTNALSYADTVPRYGLRPWLAPLHAVGALILLYAAWASAVRTLVDGAIEWRGTRYPLDVLRFGRQPAEPSDRTPG